MILGNQLGESKLFYIEGGIASVAHWYSVILLLVRPCSTRPIPTCITDQSMKCYTAKTIGQPLFGLSQFHQCDYYLEIGMPPIKFS